MGFKCWVEEIYVRVWSPQYQLWKKKEALRVNLFPWFTKTGFSNFESMGLDHESDSKLHNFGCNVALICYLSWRQRELCRGGFEPYVFKTFWVLTQNSSSLFYICKSRAQINCSYAAPFYTESWDFSVVFKAIIRSWATFPLWLRNLSAISHFWECVDLLYFLSFSD